MDDDVSGDLDDELTRLINDDVREKFEASFASLDLRQVLRRLVYRGFDSFEDYEKYGDAYVAMDVRPCGTGTR